MRRRGRTSLAVALLGLLAVSAPVAPASSDAPGGRSAGNAATTSSRAVAVQVAPRTVVARPGYRQTPSGPALDVARFTTVGTLDLPGRQTSAGWVVLTTQVRVTVPIRIALSVRAWCAASSAVGSAPDRHSMGDVLVIGQNPVPGTASTQRASRTLTGRAVVSLPAGGPHRCVLQVSPRTESTRGSRLRLASGTFSATPVRGLARAAQRPAVLVGTPGARRSLAVAVLGSVRTAGAVRLEGEAELTTCALGYHLCGRGKAPTSVVDVVLVLADLRADGTVCKTWRGSTRQVTITPAVHHVKVLAPGLTTPRRCGVAVRGHLLVTHRLGNGVEVEPVLLDPGLPRRVQTHTWLQRP